MFSSTGSVCNLLRAINSDSYFVTMFSILLSDLVDFLLTCMPIKPSSCAVVHDIRLPLGIVSST